MKLFNEDGCLTGEGLQMLISGELDELGRLEVSEHLDFCDSCVARYAALLTEEAELTPPEEQTPVVMGRLRRRRQSALLNRFTRVAVAAVLTIVIWGVGFYQNGILTPSNENLDRMRTSARSIGATLDSWGDGFNRFLSGFYDFLNTPRIEPQDNTSSQPADAGKK